MLGISSIVTIAIVFFACYFSFSSLKTGNERKAQLALYDLVSYTMTGVALLAFIWQIEARYQTALSIQNLPDRSILNTVSITNFDRANCKIAPPPEYCRALSAEISRHTNAVAARRYAFEFQLEPNYPESLQGILDEYNRSVRLQAEIRTVARQQNAYLLILSALAAAFGIGVVRRYTVWRDAR